MPQCSTQVTGYIFEIASSRWNWLLSVFFISIPSHNVNSTIDRGSNALNNVCGGPTTKRVTCGQGCPKIRRELQVQLALGEVHTTMDISSVYPAQLAWLRPCTRFACVTFHATAYNVDMSSLYHIASYICMYICTNVIYMIGEAEIRVDQSSRFDLIRVLVVRLIDAESLPYRTRR